MAAANPTFLCTRCTKPFYNQFAPKECDKCGSGIKSWTPPAAAALVFPGISKHNNEHTVPPKEFDTPDKKKAIKASTAKADTHKAGKAKFGIALADMKALLQNAYTALNGAPGLYDAQKFVGWANGEDCTKVQLYVDPQGVHGHPITDLLAASRFG